MQNTLPPPKSLDEIERHCWIAVNENPDYSASDRSDAYRWILDGMPGDTHGTSGDVGFEDGNFC